MKPSICCRPSSRHTRCGPSTPRAPGSFPASAPAPSCSNGRHWLAPARFRPLGAIAGVATAAAAADAPPTERNDSALRRAFTAAVAGRSLTRGAPLVVAHGDATRSGDAGEARALAGVLPADSLVTAFKGATGFIGAASLLVEAALALRALDTRTWPAIVGCERAATDVTTTGLELVTGTPRPLAARGGPVMLVAWSWTGACAVVTLEAAS